MIFRKVSTCLLFATSLVVLPSCSYIQNSRPYTAISDWVYSDSRPENIKQQRQSAYNFETQSAHMSVNHQTTFTKISAIQLTTKLSLTLDDQIIGARIIYEYIYNFATKQNDCAITFHTNASQSVIKSVDYNSKKCYYIARF